MWKKWWKKEAFPTLTFWGEQLAVVVLSMLSQGEVIFLFLNFRYLYYEFVLAFAMLFCIN
jgi:hypothetical protein